jgi:Tfp pilus assembly protein PilE
MKKEKGSTLVVVLSVLAIVAVLIGIGVMSYVTAYNTGNRMEKTIQATFENNKNILAQYGQKVLEAVQVPDMARDDLVKVAREAMEGRYGAEGSQAVFQMITEQNPQVDPGVYRQIQQIIEGGRTEFQNAQTRLIDQKRGYEQALGSFWLGMWLRIAGYPKVDLAEFKIVTTARAERVFEDGKEDAPIRLRSAQP